MTRMVMAVFLSTSAFEGASPCSLIPRPRKVPVIYCWCIYVRAYNHRPSLDKKATGCFASLEFTQRQETENASSRGGSMKRIIQIRYMIKFCNGEGRICLLLIGNWCQLLLKQGMMQPIGKSGKSFIYRMSVTDRDRFGELEPKERRDYPEQYRYSWIFHLCLRKMKSFLFFLIFLFRNGIQFHSNHVKQLRFFTIVSDNRTQRIAARNSTVGLLAHHLQAEEAV